MIQVHLQVDDGLIAFICSIPLMITLIRWGIKDESKGGKR